MIEWRNIIGLLALVVASAGPMPLWLHHAQCHTLSCSEGAGDCDDCVHVDAACQHQHAEQGSPAAAHLVSDGQGTPSAAQVGAYHVHDCWVCYQLSQVASVAMPLSAESSELAVDRSVFADRQFSPATICGPNAARGPPA